MPESIHRHEVQRTMIAADRASAREDLLAEIAAHFGDDARFHSRSASDLTAVEFVDFLLAWRTFHDDAGRGPSTKMRFAPTSDDE